MPDGSNVANYGFDVTPARLVTGLITERGVIPADRAALAQARRRGRSARAGARELGADVAGITPASPAGAPLAGVKVFAKSLALLAASPFRGLIRLARTGSPAIAIYPVHVALGRVMAQFRYANEQYRQPE